MSGENSALSKCMRMAEYARTNSPRVSHLLKKISAAGCTLGSPEPIVCEDVFDGARVAGAYDHSRRLVVMNPSTPESFMNQGEWTRAVAHELVHAYDSCRAKVDPDDCRHVACTEVRAANLSGDCDFGPELGRVGPSRLLLSGLAAHQQACVRRRAQLSLSMHPKCISQTIPSSSSASTPRVNRDTHGGVVGGGGKGGDDEMVVKTVASVFDACYSDWAPFSTN